MHIIQCFKAHSAAKKNGGIFLQAPDIFQLSYRKGSSAHPFLNKFKPTVLTNVSMNYTGSNVYSTFYDGTPTHMLMELSFKELNPITRRTIGRKSSRVHLQTQRKQFLTFRLEVSVTNVLLQRTTKLIHTITIQREKLF